MKALQGGWKTTYGIFFGSHIIITLCIDAQAIGSTWYPSLLRQVVAGYCHVSGDVLMNYPHSPAWFQSLVTCEILLQLPFFGVAVRQIYKHTEEYYPRWFQILCILYGSHVATTLVPILTTFWKSTHMTRTQAILTTAIYAPYLIFPLGLLYWAVQEDLAELFLPPNKKESKVD